MYATEPNLSSKKPYAAKAKHKVEYSLFIRDSGIKFDNDPPYAIIPSMQDVDKPNVKDAYDPAKKTKHQELQTVLVHSVGLLL